MIGVAALLIGIGIGSASAGSDNKDQPSSAAGETVTVTPPAETVEVTAAPTRPTKTVKVTIKVTPQPKAAISEDGIWLVGLDIKPGTYRSSGGGACYWARLSDVSGNGIITNGLGANQIVTISATDKAFETAGCGEWTRV